MGSRGPAAKNAVPSVKFAPGVPAAPEHLDDMARDEYMRVAEQMEQAGRDYLQQVDMAHLMTYAQSYSDVCRLTKVVRTEGESLLSAKGGMYPNPNNNALQMAYNRMKVAAAALGFSPSDRNRIGNKSAGKAKADPLAEFI